MDGDKPETVEARDARIKSAREANKKDHKKEDRE
jgi:hypothetical protein